MVADGAENPLARGRGGARHPPALLRHLCDCDECTEVCRRSPQVLLVIKGSVSRDVIAARPYVKYGPDALVTPGYVREVFVADQWRRRLPPRRASGDQAAEAWVGHTRSLHECLLLDALAKGSLPRPVSLSMECPCCDNPFACKHLSGTRDLATALQKAFASQSVADIEPVLAPEVLWRMPKSPAAELSRSEAHSRLRVVWVEGFSVVANVIVDPESIQLGLEVACNGRITRFVVEFVAEEGVVTEIVGPAARPFAPIPEPGCATPPSAAATRPALNPGHRALVNGCPAISRAGRSYRPLSDGSRRR